MIRFDAATPADRTALFAEAITAHRKRGSEGTAVEAMREDGDDPTAVRLVYEDGTVTFQVTDDGRERLDDLLSEFPVFKIKQPETRKAQEGTVHVSAIADPKRAGDFIEAAFREVYELPEEYQAWVVRV